MENLFRVQRQTEFFCTIFAQERTLSSLLIFIYTRAVKTRVLVSALLGRGPERAQYPVQGRCSIFLRCNRNYHLVQRTHFTDELPEAPVQGVSAVGPLDYQKSSGTDMVPRLPCSALPGSTKPASGLRPPGVCRRATSRPGGRSLRPPPAATWRGPAQPGLRTRKWRRRPGRNHSRQGGVAAEDGCRLGDPHPRTACVAAAVQGPRGLARAERGRAQGRAQGCCLSRPGVGRRGPRGSARYGAARGGAQRSPPRGGAGPGPGRAARPPRPHPSLSRPGICDLGARAPRPRRLIFLGAAATAAP